jgi:hypothetical protein
MISRRRDVLLNALKLFDMAVVVVAFGLAAIPPIFSRCESRWGTASFFLA